MNDKNSPGGSRWTKLRNVQRLVFGSKSSQLDVQKTNTTTDFRSDDDLRLVRETNADGAALSDHTAIKEQSHWSKLKNMNRFAFNHINHFKISEPDSAILDQEQKEDFSDDISINSGDGESGKDPIIPLSTLPSILLESPRKTSRWSKIRILNQVAFHPRRKLSNSNESGSSSTAETGKNKELVAFQNHRNSPRQELHQHSKPMNYKPQRDGPSLTLRRQASINSIQTITMHLVAMCERETLLHVLRFSTADARRLAPHAVLEVLRADETLWLPSASVAFVCKGNVSVLYRGLRIESAGVDAFLASAVPGASEAARPSAGVSLVALAGGAALSVLKFADLRAALPRATSSALGAADDPWALLHAAGAECADRWRAAWAAVALQCAIRCHRARKTSVATVCDQPWYRAARHRAAGCLQRGARSHLARRRLRDARRAELGTDGAALVAAAGPTDSQLAAKRIQIFFRLTKRIQVIVDSWLLFSKFCSESAASRCLHCGSVVIYCHHDSFILFLNLPSYLASPLSAQVARQPSDVAAGVRAAKAAAAAADAARSDELLRGNALVQRWANRALAMCLRAWAARVRSTASLVESGHRAVQVGAYAGPPPARFEAPSEAECCRPQCRLELRPNRAKTRARKFRTEMITGPPVQAPSSTGHRLGPAAEPGAPAETVPFKSADRPNWSVHLNHFVDLLVKICGGGARACCTGASSSASGGGGSCTRATRTWSSRGRPAQACRCASVGSGGVAGMARQRLPTSPACCQAG